MIRRFLSVAVIGGLALGSAPSALLGQLPGSGATGFPGFPTSARANALAAEGTDTIVASGFDYGKMWTFDFPPSDYLEATYGLRPDSAWLRHARLGALRIPGCSASLVSPNGLVLTNHHCARESVVAVQQPGETILDDGFYASSLDQERAIEDFSAEQLVEIRDVTAEVNAALEGVVEAQERSALRQSTIEAIQDRISEEFGGEEAGVSVEVISLYAGARYSAYRFRRYDDVRLVLAPELQIGFFGGDPDNFTFPRYNLDFSFLRIYDDEGGPLDTEDVYFRWSETGVADGDLVFVIGNPGSTSRLQTVAELVFRRDVSDKGLLEFVDGRIDAFGEFISAFPEEAEVHGLRNTLFSLQNTQKAYRGMVGGLADPGILARRAAAEQEFLDSLQARPELQAQYGGLVERLEEIQAEKAVVAAGFGTIYSLTTDWVSPTLNRALLANQILGMTMNGAPQEDIDQMRESFDAVPQWPAVLDELLIEVTVRDFARNYGETNPMVLQLLQGRTAEGLAAVVRSGSALSDSATAGASLTIEALGSDPAMGFLAAFLPPLGQFQNVVIGLQAEEEEIHSQIGRARFEIWGASQPPDATFSLRLADGVVGGYPYNGTVAPPYTTFYGLYDRYYSFKTADWDLPSRWAPAPEGLALSTPVNFAFTADIIGGNSGSPVVNQDLEVVGLVFDGNIESLPGDYIYLPALNRAVAVDSRGILEALDEVYDADRIVLELIAGTLAETEAEADRIRGG